MKINYIYGDNYQKAKKNLTTMLVHRLHNKKEISYLLDVNEHISDKNLRIDIDNFEYSFDFLTDIFVV